MKQLRCKSILITSNDKQKMPASGISFSIRDSLSASTLGLLHKEGKGKKEGGILSRKNEKSEKRLFAKVALAERNLFVNRKRNPIKKTEDSRIQSKRLPKIFCGVPVFMQLFLALLAFFFAFLLPHCFSQ
ncbi:hypothetical protein CEXT_390191 [Caerostris extrusa]|uniref:Transmembrane protein n=1 Tax=Caerostris extrusa TaxID=172846 RepID=A0AAV4NPW9_CAEEX|nr:hypothetical protein CEXT_390191 [Caerostris extrusa]